MVGRGSRLIALAATLASVVGGPGLAAPAGVDPAIGCYFDALGKDAKALAGCFAPDGFIVDVSRRIEGPDAIERWAAREVIGGRLDLLAVEARPDGQRLLVHWAPKGSAGWRAWYGFVVRDGRILSADLQYA